MWWFLSCSAPSPPADVLLVSIDGTPPGLVDDAWEELEWLPGLTAEPDLQRIDLFLQGTPVTMPAHAIMLTGYGPEVTGVYHPSEGNYGTIPEGLGYLERLEDRYGKHVRTLFVASKPFMVGSTNPEYPFWHMGQRSDVHFNRNVFADEVVDVFLDGLDGLERDEHFAGFLHIQEVDEAAHATFERSPEHRDELVRADAELARLQRQLEERGRWARLQLFVTTDHSFTPGLDTHVQDANDVWLITSADPDGLGLTRDIPKRILELQGAESM